MAPRRVDRAQRLYFMYAYWHKLRDTDDPTEAASKRLATIESSAAMRWIRKNKALFS
jgi:hypothetical protein